jgi:hypothetical protein
MKLVSRLLFACLIAGALSAQERVNPYRCEGTARDVGRTLPLGEVKAKADELAKSSDAVDLCTAAELYKRLGDGKARALYEKAIKTDEDANKAAPEPAYELLYGDYLRLYRGAGQRPLFQEAEKHLFAARGKLLTLRKESSPDIWKECSKELWNKCTEDRLQRSLAALYERDGFHLAEWTWKAEGSRAAVERPWLFFSPGVRWEQANADFDRTSDVRDRASEAAFSASRFRLNRPLTQGESDGLVRLMTPLEGTERLRIRFQSAPIIDFFATERRTGDAQVTNFYQPNRFNDLKLLDVGVAIEKPFAITGNTDGVARFAYHRVNREGLIEFLPAAAERINQYEASGALSQYLGPDRLNLSYVYVRQDINPEPTSLQRRDREITGGTANYQIFRPLPLPGRNLETGLGRQFETRGIDLFGGVLNDDERYPASPTDVFVTRRDYFAGIAARGLKRFDVTVQPTWFTSRVSNDPTQDNSQLRMAGNVLFRILDEERTGGIPKERVLGLPVASVQLVVPFHWDIAREGNDAFRSRRAGAELWVKCISAGNVGVSILSVVGYSRQWFPGLNRELNLVRIGVGVGF